MALGDAGKIALGLSTQLNKIGFVEFTSDMVRNVYSIIVTSSMDQLRAYADFVQQVAKTLTEYQDEVVGTGTAQEVTADSYIKDVLGLTPAISITLSADQIQALKEHFGGVTSTTTPVTIADAITVTVPTDPDSGGNISLENLRKFVIEKLRANATDSYELMKTILKIGMQKIVVADGEIASKLTFHVDSSDVQMASSYEYTEKASSWGVRANLLGRFGGSSGSVAGVAFGKFIGGTISGGYAARKINVVVVNEVSTAAVNLRIDIIGSVRIGFRTETFPAPPV